MPKSETFTLVAPTKIELVDVKLIDSSPHNIPGRDKDVDELAESIRARGLMNPVTLTPVNGRFRMVAGHRRLAAVKKLGVGQISATIRPQENDQEAVLDLAVENLQREDVTPMQEARIYRQLADLGMKQREIGHQLGRSQPHVAKRLALTELPDEVQEAVDAGGIHVNDAFTLQAEFKDDPDSLLRVFHNRGKANLGFLISQVKSAKDRAAAKEAAPEKSEDDIKAEKDAGAKRRLVNRLLKQADEKRFGALQANVKARVAKTKILDWTLKGLIEFVKATDKTVFEAACSLVGMTKVNNPTGFDTVYDVDGYVAKNPEENWIRLANAVVLVKGHLALVGAKEPISGIDLRFAASTLEFLNSHVGYHAGQAENYLLGLMDVGEIEPPVKEEKPKAEPKAKKPKTEAKAATAENGQAVEVTEMPVEVPAGK